VLHLSDNRAWCTSCTWKKWRCGFRSQMKSPWKDQLNRGGGNRWQDKSLSSSQALWRAAEKSRWSAPGETRAWANSWQFCKEFFSVSQMAASNKPLLSPSFPGGDNWSLGKLFYLSRRMPLCGTARCITHRTLDAPLLFLQMTSPGKSTELLQTIYS